MAPFFMAFWPLATAYFELLSRVTGVGDHWFSPLVEAMLFFSRETMFFNQIVIMAKNSDKTCFNSIL